MSDFWIFKIFRSMFRNPDPVWVGVALASLSLSLGGCGGSDKTPEPSVGPDPATAIAPVPQESADDASAVAAVLPNKPEDTFPNGFVGTATCAECHRERHESYLLTHHSRSLRPPVADDHPLGVAFHHEPSRRSYVVERNGDKFVHREDRYFGDDPETRDRMRLASLPVEYVMGSGAFAKAYLVRDGDYLLQSPVTWYTQRNAHEIAPGYDDSNQAGFARIIEDTCVYCHAGLISKQDDNPNRFVLHELAIGCERCHGPGESHTELYRQIARSGDDPPADKEIVNPNTLDRRLSESICAQCHLDSEVTVFASGETFWDYDPGEDLTLNRLSYKATKVTDSAEVAKTFSNHFDQMWNSQCYLQSETLTCTSCHDPHDPNPPVDRIAAFRKVCLDCHADEGCKKPIHERETQNKNACTSCHMPRAPSDIPHASITNHLIAVYDEGRPRGVTPSDERPLRRVTRSVDVLSPQELKRRDVMAKSAWSVLKTMDGDMEPILKVDENELASLESSEQVDVQALLAKLLSQRAKVLELEDSSNPDLKQLRDRFEVHASKVLASEKSPTKRRQEMLEILADKKMVDQDHQRAILLYEELTRIRRNAADWYNLALALAGARRLGDAEAALQTAVAIDPAYVKAYVSLAKLYSYVDADTAARFREIAIRLSE